MAVVQKYGLGFKKPGDQAWQVKKQHAEGDVRAISTGALAVANGDSINSKVYFGRIPSSAIPDVYNSVISHSAITGLSDFDVGIEQAGVVKDADILADGLTFASAGTKNPFAAIAIADIGKPLWQLLGLSSDPGVDYDIVGTFNAAATADGTIAAQIQYVF